MAKKAAGKKKTATKAKAAKPSAKPSAKKAAAKPAAKTASQTASKAASKPTGKTAKKPAKSATKPSTKKPAAKAAKPAAPKPAAAKTPAPKTAAKSATTAAKSSAKAPSKSKPAKPDTAAASEADAKKGGRKGITIVSQKPGRKPAAKAAPKTAAPPSMGRLLDPKNPIRKPLIPSGPNAASTRPLGAPGAAEENHKGLTKSPFGKRELDKYRKVLLSKRAELVGDINTIETEALRGQSGSLSNLPQHIAEQGSDNYDQSLSLDLAAADRKLLKEIDDALMRIEQGTYGICEISGRAIRAERLEELPWARYSIEAARERERQHMMR